MPHLRSALAPLVLVLALAPAAPAQETLRRVRLRAGPAQVEELRAGGYDVLEGSVGGGEVELVVSVAELELLRAAGRAPRVVEVGRPLRAVLAERDTDGSVPGGYPDLAQVVASLNATAAAFPAIAQVVDLTARYGVPATFEGRHLYALKISDNVAQDEDEPNVLLVSAHHCREVVTPVIALDAIARLTSQYGGNPTVTALVDGSEIWIAPVWNPDGYEHTFNVDNLWRKNRRVFAQGVGVDLNRNYPFGWSTACAGSTTVSSQTYKGPAPASEAETQTMLALHADRHFAKIADFHSFGRELLHGYSCGTHPFASFFQAEAQALATAAGYGGSTSPPSANGEQFQTPLALMGAHAFLWETHTTFQPSFASAQTEAAQVWPSFLSHATRAISVAGRVTDAGTGQPLVATLDLPGVGFANGETNQSEARFGRYHVFLPAGAWSVRFSAPGYVSQTHPVTVVGTGGQTLDVALVPETVTYCSGKTTSLGCVPFVSFTGVPSASATAPFSIRANDLVPSELGVLLYGVSGRSNLNFHGGKLCVKAPLTRLLPAKLANNTGAPPCTGVLTRNFNARIQSGVDPALLPGQTVQAQWRQRDPALMDGFDDVLTDGIEFTIEP